MHPFALYYDAEIGILLVASAAVCFLLERDRRRVPDSWAARHALVARRIAITAALFFSVIFYGSFIEPHLITLHTVQLRLHTRTLPAPLRIAVVSDYHMGPYKGEAFTRRSVRLLQGLHPDAVLIAGDFVYSDDGVQDWDKLTPLSELAKNIPVIAVLGNHDTGLGDEYHFVARPENAAAIRQTLEGLGIRVLENEHVLLERDGARVAVAGLAEYLTGNSNHLDALRGIPPEVPRIVLAHNPGVVRFLDPTTIDLVIAGHTHGGQIRIPFLPPLVRLPTPLGQHFDSGLFTFNTIPLFITRGIGESGPRARLFMPPEIAVLTIQ